MDDRLREWSDGGVSVRFFPLTPEVEVPEGAMNVGVYLVWHPVERCGPSAMCSRARTTRRSMMC